MRTITVKQEHITYQPDVLIGCDNKTGKIVATLHFDNDHIHYYRCLEILDKPVTPFGDRLVCVVTNQTGAGLSEFGFDYDD